MSGEIPERVICEVCGTSFDPRESRGWCPNEVCGKWQHPAFPLSDGAAGREAADGGVNAPTKVCPSCGKDVRADANFCKFCSHEFPDEPAQEPSGGEASGLDACPDCGADLSSIPPDRLADCPICGTDLSDVLADRSEPEVTPADLTDCPACGADLTNIPADMRMVCPDCRVDLQEAIRTHGVGGEEGGGVQQAGAQEAGAPGAGAGGQAGSADVGAGGEAGGGADTGDATASVDTIKGIGASYADRLASAGVETVGDLVRADAAELSAATDISEKRLGEWAERAPVDSSDVGGGQESSTGGRQAGASGRQGGQQGGRASSGQGAGAGEQAGSRRDERRQPSVPSGSSSGDQAGTGGGGRAGARNGEQQGTGGRQARPRYSTLVLEVMGQEIRASPGDTVGREIRTAMVEGGAPDDDAVYVHREHVRVEREGETFYLVRLGQNSLKVNGTPVGQHERAEVSNGDEVSFSEVVTADVRLE